MRYEELRLPYMTGKIKGKKTRLVAQNIVRAGSVWLGYELMKHNQKQGR